MVTEKEDRNDVFLEEAEYQKKLIAASFKTRVISIFAALLCAGILGKVLKLDVSPGVMAVLISWAAISGIYLWIFNSGRIFSERAVGNIHFSYYLPGVLLSSFLVHYIGGVEWIAFSMYFFDLIYANMLLRRGRGKIVTFGVFVCYFTIIFLEYYGIIPHYRIIPMYELSYNNLSYVAGTGILVIGVMLFLVSYVTGLFARIKEDRKRELLIAREREEFRTGQLEELSVSLKTRVEENEFLRTRTADYIREKENQLGSAKDDLEQQVETFRKTQKAMQYMIEDLNEMSRELRTIKDHLEEKVEKRTEELMEISDKLYRNEKLAFMGKLAGSVTHELRNSMAVIRNAAYFLESNCGEAFDDKSREYLKMIRKEVVNMDSIVEDIMGFAAKKSVSFKETDLRNVVEEALALIDVPELVRITKNFETTSLVMIDVKQLEHAVVNIANNSIMAMKGNGILSFWIGAEGDEVCIKISDTGGGIPEEYRELIFEPLYSTKPKGTGLGLPIAKMMVESQNGTITLESHLGVGSTFTIRIPMLVKD